MNRTHTPIDDRIPQASAPSKEAEPVAPKEAPAHIEIHKMIEHESKDEEVKPYILHREETIKPSKELEDMGVTSTGHTAFPAHEPIHIPLTNAKIEQGLHKPITSSFRWLAELCVYLLKQMHAGIKVAHGKIIR